MPRNVLLVFATGATCGFVIAAALWWTPEPVYNNPLYELCLMHKGNKIACDALMRLVNAANKQQ